MSPVILNALQWCIPRGQSLILAVFVSSSAGVVLPQMRDTESVSKLLLACSMVLLLTPQMASTSTVQIPLYNDPQDLHVDLVGNRI